MNIIKLIGEEMKKNGLIVWVSVFIAAFVLPSSAEVVGDVEVVLPLPAESALDTQQIYDLFKQERYIDADQKMDAWRLTHPDAAADLESLRSLGHALRNEPSKEKRALIILESGMKQINEMAPLFAGIENNLKKMANFSTAGQLIDAIDKEDLSALEQLLSEGANCEDDLIGPVLPYAAGKGNVEVLKMLLAHGASLETPDKIRGETPLFAAVLHEQEDAVAFLVTSGAQVDTKNENNQTALDIAIKKNNLAIIKILQDAN